MNPANNDAISIPDQHSNIGGAHHVVLDHISASWGEDETICAWYGAHDITVSWSIISRDYRDSAADVSARHAQVADLPSGMVVDRDGFLEILGVPGPG